jgi:hypothetical protein
MRTFIFKRLALTTLAVTVCAQSALAWGGTGHTMISRAAAESLPT